MKKVVKKTNNKSSWVLRTFTSREKELMQTLRKSVIVSNYDYGNVVWAKTKTQIDREILEGALRNFSR